MKHTVTILNTFNGLLSLGEIMGYAIPFVDDLLQAQLEYLKEKAEAERKAHQAAANASGSPKSRVV